MSALVKAAASRDIVSPFVPRSASPEPTEAPAAGPRLVAAEEVEQLAAELATVRADAVRAAEAARETGRQEALREASAADDRRLLSLERALASAAKRLDETLDAVEDLAGALAATALARLIAPDVAMSDLVERSLERQMQLLRRETVVAIRVSLTDFPDDEALQALSAQAGTGLARAIVDPALGTGECGIDLSLGHVDLGVPARWREAVALLAGPNQSGDAS